MNTQQPLLSATGRPLFKVGEDSYRQFTEGEYVVSLEWHNDTGSKSEPIMVIWPQYAGRNSGVFGVCLSSIGKYADPSGSPSHDPEGWETVIEALDVLGRELCLREAHKLMDVILRHTPDLIRMPPSPADLKKKDAGAPIWEIEIQDENGKTIKEASV